MINKQNRIALSNGTKTIYSSKESVKAWNKAGYKELKAEVKVVPLKVTKDKEQENE